MTDLAVYLENAEPEQVELLRRQWQEATETKAAHCICGQLRAIELMFRCLYCGFYFCVNCAGEHFGETRESWRARNHGKHETAV